MGSGGSAGRLRGELTEFVGRRAELARVRAAMQGARLRVMLPTKPNTVIQHSPQMTGDAVTLAQTAGDAPDFRS